MRLSIGVVPFESNVVWQVVLHGGVFIQSCAEKALGFPEIGLGNVGEVYVMSGEPAPEKGGVPPAGVGENVWPAVAVPYVPLLLLPDVSSATGGVPVGETSFNGQYPAGLY